jgi:hypothetical protein
MGFSLRGRHFGETADRVAAELALLLQDAGDLAVGSGQLDHAAHLDDGTHVGFLDRTLLNPHGDGGRLLLKSGGGVEGARSVLLQALRVCEGDEPQPAAAGVDRALPLLHPDGAVRVDDDVAVGRTEGNRPVLADHLVARAGDELALRVDLERAVAGVALAARRLHHKEGVAFDRDVERVAGLLDAALGHVVPGLAVLHEAHPAQRAGRLVVRAGLQVLGEHRAVGLEAGGVQVRDVVGDDFELASQHSLPRQANENRVLHHRTYSPLRRRLAPSQGLIPAAVSMALPSRARQARCRARARAKSRVGSKGWIRSRRESGRQNAPALPVLPGNNCHLRGAGKHPLTITAVPSIS